MAPGSAKNKKSRPPPIEVRKCGKRGCDIDSEELMTCFECKSIFHPECADFDSVLYQSLTKNTSQGLSWLWRCHSCITPGDVINQNEITKAVNDLICSKFDELKNSLNENVGHLVTTKFDEFKNSLAKKQQDNITLKAADNKSSTSVSVQTNFTCAESREKLTSIEDKEHVEETNKPICKYFKQGRCRHGGNGRKIIDGRECMFEHPRKCLKYCKYGSDKFKGCNGPCDLLHPILCKNSIQYRQCFRHDCTFAHLQGTERYINEAHGYNVDTRYSFNNNNNIRNYRDSPATAGHMMNGPSLPVQNFLYKQHEFPKLRSAEEMNFSQLSHDIRTMMKDSIEHILKSSSQKDQHGNAFEQAPGGYPSNNDRSNLPMQNHTQYGNPKNFPRQNQFYPEQDHYQH